MIVEKHYSFTRDLDRRDNTPLLSICCITYNHELYLRDTIDGFLIQKTTFPIEIIIHDDASTDKTAEIIKEYVVKHPVLIIPVLQSENQYSKGIKAYPKYVWPRTRGKYIALCEGDDYWTDPYKLQKQVDFLESNPDYGLVHSDLDHHYVISGNYVRNHWVVNNVDKQSGEIYHSLMLGQQSMIYACTACFRSDFIKGSEYQEIVNQNFSIGDTPLWLMIASKSRIGYLKESTAVRNVLASSATQGRSLNDKIDLIETGKKIFEYFDNYKPVDPFDKKRYLNRYYIHKMEQCFLYNENRYLFESCFSLMDNEYKNNILLLKRVGMRTNLLHFIIRIFIKLYTKIHIPATKS